MAGDERLMAAEMSALMFHRATGHIRAFKSGYLEEMEAWDAEALKRSAVNGLKRLDADAASMVTARSGMTAKEVAAMFAQDTWLDAREAMASGIATGLVPESADEGEDAPSGDEPAGSGRADIGGGSRQAVSQRRVR